MRIAVAGHSGLTWNAHFGRAEFFDIFEVNADTQRFLERKFTIPACGAEGGRNDRGENQGLAHSIDLLAGCSAVVAGQIGPCAREILAVRGIAAIEHAGPRLAGTDAILQGLIDESRDSSTRSSEHG